MFVRNRWEMFTSSPANKDGKNGAFWLLRGVIHDFFWGGGGQGGFAVSFLMILSKIVAPWGLPII